jgi:flagellar protein FliS
MFLTNQHPASTYANISVETGVSSATPNQLTVMLYEGAIISCNMAIDKMKSGDISVKSILITKAINIIQGGLSKSLNKNVGGEIAINLDALYTYMVQRLYTANISNNPSILEEVIKLLIQLKGAWEAIEPDKQFQIS